MKGGSSGTSSSCSSAGNVASAWRIRSAIDVKAHLSKYLRAVRNGGEWLEAVDLVLLRPPVLGRASEPMPMPIGTP